MSILKLIAAMRRRQAAAVKAEPTDPRTIARRRQYQTAADQAHTSRLPATDDDVIAADAAVLLAEVTRVQQDPLLDVPLQRGPGERGGLPFGIAVYPLTDKPLPEFDPEQCYCAATSNPPCAYCERGEYQPW